MDIITSAEARNTFPDLVGKAAYGKKRTVITRRGKKVAAIIPIEDLERLQAIENAIDIERIEEALHHDEFESWGEAKKDILKHFGITDHGVQHRHSKKGQKVHQGPSKTRSIKDR